jgi:putative ATP-binding cassette transporter
MSAYTGHQMKKQKFGEVVKRIWKIAAPYWMYSEEKWGSLVLLGINIVIMVLTNFVGLRMVIWNQDWTNALVNKDVSLWHQQIFVFLLVGAAMIFTGTFNMYIQQWIAIRWRRWMTARYLRLWLEHHSHYKMTLTGNETDNPDQRITEDITLFITNTWTFSFSFVQNLLSLGTYIVVLWGYSNVPLVIGSQFAENGRYVMGTGRHLEFPGYLVLLSLVWAIVTTTVAHFMGKAQSRLTYSQQMYDANFRFSLVRFRESSEQIALLKGEQVEHSNLMNIFGDSVMNTFRTMGVGMRFGLVTGILQYVDAMMFTLILGPAWLWLNQGITSYGQFNLIATAFSTVVTGFKWFQTSYMALAGYIAVIDRLYAFNDNYDRTIEITEHSELKILKDPESDKIVIDDIAVSLPTGKVQITADHIELRPGEKILIKGRTGAGKTTLFRAISGIWPLAKGEVTLPADKKVIVLPQRPYFPIGTLIQAVSYPLPENTYDRETIKQVLVEVGLPQFVDRIDEVQHWNQLLSGGEQQRVGIARALLMNADYMFFDEATASMDEPSEEALYSMLLERAQNATIISIGHRSSLQKFHKRLLVAEGDPNGTYHIEERNLDDDDE